MPTTYERFLALSADLTAHTAFELQGTGLAQRYVDAVGEIAGAEVLGALLDAYDRATGDTSPSAGPAGPDELQAHVVRLRAEVFSDPWVGPVARNVIKLWYVGLWYQLPAAWRDRYGARPRDTTHMVTGAGYVEALLWPAIGASPPGAKAPGFGSWAAPPRIPTFR